MCRLMQHLPILICHEEFERVDADDEKGQEELREFALEQEKAQAEQQQHALRASTSGRGGEDRKSC